MIKKKYAEAEGERTLIQKFVFCCVDICYISYYYNTINFQILTLDTVPVYINITIRTLTCFYKSQQSTFTIPVTR